MPSNDLPQGIYAPLSQAMTDSDSEEEIHNSNKLLNVKNHHKRLAPQYFFNFENLNNHYNNYNCRNFYNKSSNRSNKMSSNEGTIDAGSLASFNSESDIQNTSADNVAILGSSAKKNSSNGDGMSPLRKLCFIGSILFCFFTVAVFLWVIPCNDGGVCPAPVDRMKTHNWINNYTMLELKGKINVIEGKEGRPWEKCLLFLFRGDAFYPEFVQNNNKRKNGIVSIESSSGTIWWVVYHKNEPLSMDCSLIDVDNNGKADCLIVDDVGQIGVINPTSGAKWWEYIPPAPQKIDTLDLPVILPDMDNDNVYEILLATSRNSNETRRRNYIRIISGKTGKPIGNGHLIHDCIKIRKLQLDGDMVNFLCVQNKTDVKRSKTILELYALVTNKSIGQKIGKSNNIPQFKSYGQRKEIEHQGNLYILNGRELYIENNGKCPQNCSMTFILSEKQNGKVVTIKNFTQSNMYGMVPTQWHFKTAKSELSGFVVKFWKWEDMDSNDTSPRTKRDLTADYEFNVFDQLIQKRHTFSIPPKRRVERSIANITKQKSGTNNYKMQLIKETVYIIIFNGGHTDFENTSQSNIVQFCRNNSDHDMICQPDLNNQENSLLIADLDQDGSQELVSYYSTFVNQNEDNKAWKLVTYVNLLRLEAELPSLYENGIVGNGATNNINNNIAVNANV